MFRPTPHQDQMFRPLNKHHGQIQDAEATSVIFQGTHASKLICIVYVCGFVYDYGFSKQRDNDRRSSIK